MQIHSLEVYKQALKAIRILQKDIFKYNFFIITYNYINKCYVFHFPKEDGKLSLSNDTDMLKVEGSFHSYKVPLDILAGFTYTHTTNCNPTKTPKQLLNFYEQICKALKISEPHKELKQICNLLAAAMCYYQETNKEAVFPDSKILQTFITTLSSFYNKLKFNMLVKDGLYNIVLIYEKNDPLAEYDNFLATIDLESLKKQAYVILDALTDTEDINKTWYLLNKITGKTVYIVSAYFDKSCIKKLDAETIQEIISQPANYSISMSGIKLAVLASIIINILNNKDNGDITADSIIATLRDAISKYETDEPDKIDLVFLVTVSMFDKLFNGSIIGTSINDTHIIFSKLC